jgi:hypothetical protein
MEIFRAGGDMKQCEETLGKDWAKRCSKTAVLKLIFIDRNDIESCSYFCLQHAKMNGYHETKLNKWEGTGTFGKSMWKKVNKYGK